MTLDPAARKSSRRSWSVASPQSSRRGWWGMVHLVHLSSWRAHLAACLPPHSPACVPFVEIHGARSTSGAFGACCMAARVKRPARWSGRKGRSQIHCDACHRPCQDVRRHVLLELLEDQGAKCLKKLSARRGKGGTVSRNHCTSLCGMSFSRTVRSLPKVSRSTWAR